MRVAIRYPRCSPERLGRPQKFTIFFVKSNGSGGGTRTPDTRIRCLVPAVGWFCGVKSFRTEQNGRQVLPFGHCILRLFQIQQVAFSRKEDAVPGPHSRSYVFRLAGFSVMKSWSAMDGLIFQFESAAIDKNIIRTNVSITRKF